ncbi:MAG: hypothetical protein Q4P32_06935, partial [Micrococcales bacterium]|nr:hypothetical protein [Micrococcales bacterium]
GDEPLVLSAAGDSLRCRRARLHSRTVAAGLSVAAACAIIVIPGARAAPAQANTPSPGTPTPGLVAPVGPGHRGGEKLLRTGALVIDRPAGVPQPPAFPAGAYLIANLDTGDVLLSFNSKVQSLPASTMKALTLLTVAPRLDPTAMIKAMPEDATVDGTKVGMDPGASYTVDQLLHALIMSSANDASVALARANGGMSATVTQLNEVAKEIGALDTTARNTSGLDATGQVTTAYDLALIGRAALADPRIARMLTTRTLDFPAGRTKRGQARGKYQINNHNKLLWNYAGTIGVKNGYTLKAHQTYIGAARRGSQAYVVTYLAGETGGWRPTAALLDWAFAYGPRLKAVGTLNQPESSRDSAAAADTTPGSTGAQAAVATTTAGAMEAARLLSNRPVAIAGLAIAALAAAALFSRVWAVRRRRGRLHRTR